MATPVFPILSSTSPHLGFPGTAWDVTKIPTFKTTQQRSMTGRRTAVPHYAYPHYKYQFVVNLLRDVRTTARNVTKTAPFNEFDTAMAFFLRRHGSASPFFIVDDSDHLVANQTIIASTPASTTDYQMVRTVTCSEGSFTEPVGGIDTITELRVDGTPTTAYTKNSPYDGWIRFDSAPASGKAITADFSYYAKVTFEADTLEFHTQLVDRWEVRKLNLETWR